MGTSDLAAPVAIVGMSCRLPGGIDSPEDFWEFLLAGKDAIGDIPPARWESYTRNNPANAGALRNTTKRGGFLADVAGFDADFFGVTPREAELMDPQQRITLELSWEALEHAGLAPHALAGSDTGVFMGVGSDDYGRQMLEDLPRIEAWTGIGASCCAVANRVSYTLDLRGPSFSVDTACSSSLVAIHLACNSLRNGESTVAIAGGVNVIAGPGLSMVLDAAGATSPGGQSKPFDESADGYGRGEGAGVLVLKLLADAQRDDDRVLAVIRGSAVSQDGRTNGIMAPNGAAQAQVARQALRQADVDPSTVSYVEAHGTGTRAGDPVEVAALSSVFGAGRPAGDPCLIGSVKGNIGHLEAGAGVAGVIKAVLAITHGEIPPQAGFTTPNSSISWDTSGLRVVAEPTSWPSVSTPRRAGVSAFGYGGTVGHVVLEQAPVLAASPTRSGTAKPMVFPVSAKSEAAVRAYAGELAGRLSRDDDQATLAALHHTLWRRRSHLPWRAAVVAQDAASLRYELRRLATDQPSAGVTTGSVLADRAVWVFSGHGSQWNGMGRQLLDEPVFAAVIAEIEPIFVAELGFSPREALADGDLGGVGRIQSLIFAVQVGLAEVWRSLGLRPAAVIGHSVGEVAAAVVAGVFSVADGARLICRRSTLVQLAAGGGAMAMVSLPFDEVERRVPDGVVAAIESSPVSTVVAGDPHAVQEFRSLLEAEGVRVRPVASDVAFHSPQMDPLLPRLEVALADLEPAEPTIPVYVTALADPHANPLRTADYWAANLRNPVRLAGAVTAAAADGYRIFLELSGHPVVTHSISETLDELGIEDTFVTGSLRRDQDTDTMLQTSLAALHCHGCEIDHGGPGELADLPRRTWQHRTYWHAAAAGGDWAGSPHDADSGNLLGALVTVAGASSLRVWRTRLDEDSTPYPGNHPVQGVEVVPAAVLLNTFFAAAGRRELADVRLRAPLTVYLPREVQVLEQDGTVRLLSKPDDGSTWETHTTATLSTVDIVGRLDATGCTRTLPPSAGIDLLRSVGITDTGFSWTVEELRAGESELFARVTPSAEFGWESVVDAVLSITSLVFDGEPKLRIAAEIRRIGLSGAEPEAVQVHIRCVGAETVDVLIADGDGKAIGVIEGMRYAALDGDPGAGLDTGGLVHEIVWQETTRPNRPLRTVLAVGGTLPGATTVDTVDELPAALNGLDDSDVVVVVAGQGTGGEETWRLARAAQSIAALGLTRPPRLWSITADLPGHGGLHGLGRVIGGEHPELWGGTVDVTSGDVDPQQILDVLATSGDPDVLRPVDGKLFAARIVPVRREPEREPLRCRADGTYLITGGLGVLGREVARWLATRGARRLILAGRTPMPSRSKWDDTDPRVAAMRDLEALGVTVRTVAVDIADGEAAAAALDTDALGLPPIKGVVHAAGALDNRVLEDLDEASLSTVWRSKVDGALVLDELFPAGSVDFFVLFSSLGQFLGLTGQSSYGSANSSLDGLARRRAAQGCDGTLSLGWTSWRAMGMAVSEVVDEELRGAGVTDISATEAFLAWEHASRYRLSHALVFRTRPRESAGEPAPVLRELRFEQVAGRQAEGPDFAAMTAQELLADVVAQVAAEVRMPADELAPGRPLTQLGLDSVMTLAIRRRLEKRFRLNLPATLLWNMPTVAALNEYLLERLSERDEA